MPALNGIDAARQIMHNDPHQKVAILSITDSEQVIHEALKAGANAYISKSDEPRP
jgi:DNA-binding NarL/FixJ family response regulator